MTLAVTHTLEIWEKKIRKKMCYSLFCTATQEAVVLLLSWTKFAVYIILCVFGLLEPNFGVI
jgi:hypothetical protein